MNFVSWYFWAKHRDQEMTQKTKTRKLAMWQNAICAAVIVGAAFVYHMILVRIGGEVAWFDAFTLSIGIVATIIDNYASTTANQQFAYATI